MSSTREKKDYRNVTKRGLHEFLCKYCRQCTPYFMYKFYNSAVFQILGFRCSRARWMAFQMCYIMSRFEDLGKNGNTPNSNESSCNHNRAFQHNTCSVEKSIVLLKWAQSISMKAGHEWVHLVKKKI